MKNAAILVCAVLMPFCVSCGRTSDALRADMEKATEIAHQVKEQVQAIPHAQQIKAEIERLIAAVERRTSKLSRTHVTWLMFD